MTATKENATNQGNAVSIIRIMYGAFIALGVYYLFRKDIESAMSTLGIAMAFDPFNPKVAWNKRPAYQQIWLLVHLSLVLGLLGILLFNWIG